MTKSFPFGMPFEKHNDTRDNKPNSRLVFVFQIVDQDTTRLMSLLGEAKEEKTMEIHVCQSRIHGADDPNQGFEQRCRIKKNKRVSYIGMIQTHGPVQLGMGSSNSKGLTNILKTFTLPRTNEDGTSAPIIRKLVQSSMRCETLDRSNI